MTILQSIDQYLKKISDIKLKLDSFRPYNQTQLINLQQWFRVGYIHSTNAIEGNTLSLSEVKVLLEDGITIGGKTVKEINETLNHGKLLDKLYNFFGSNKKNITESFVLQLHRDLMKDVVDKEFLGKRRTINIHISGSDDVFPGPKQLSGKMSDFFSSKICLCKTLEDVATLHYDFVKIHPFVDGNGRIARILMNLGLIKLGFFPIIIPKIVRNEYIASLQGNNFKKWYEFFLWQVYENQKDYLRFFENN